MFWIKSRPGPDHLPKDEVEARTEPVPLDGIETPDRTVSSPGRILNSIGQQASLLNKLKKDRSIMRAKSPSLSLALAHLVALPALALLAALPALALLAALPALASAQASSGAGSEMHREIVRRVLATTPLVDGHNDLPWEIRNSAAMDVSAYDLRTRTSGHTDLERLRKGGVGAQFWSVYVPFEAVQEGAAKVQLEEIDIARQIIARYPDHLELALSTSDVDRIFGSGKIASMLGMEGGHAIENSLGALRAFYDLGVRYMTLTHGGTIDWLDSATDEAKHNGLTAFGAEVVREMNRLGMLVDLSHVSPKGMADVLEVAEAPVIFSHSSARALTDHPRNVPDAILRRMPENGGVVMVTFVPSFINEDVRTYDGPPEGIPRATLGDVADHIEHVRDIAGIDHVGIGSDFDGITSTPIGLEDVSTYPALLEELSRRGWSEEDLGKVTGENLLRAWREAETAARRIQRERGPSVATIQELDGREGG
jgi:membrane dipeptidase